MDTQERKHSELEKKMSKKYHMVKFFERKKIKKNIRQVEKKLEEVIIPGDAQDRIQVALTIA